MLGAHWNSLSWRSKVAKASLKESLISCCPCKGICRALHKLQSQMRLTIFRGSSNMVSLGECRQTTWLWRKLCKTKSVLSGYVLPSGLVQRGERKAVQMTVLHESCQSSLIEEQSALKFVYGICTRAGSLLQMDSSIVNSILPYGD